MSNEGPISCGQRAASAHTFSRGWEYSQSRYFRNFHLHPSCPSQSRPLSSSKLLLVSHPYLSPAQGLFLPSMDPLVAPCCLWGWNLEQNLHGDPCTSHLFIVVSLLHFPPRMPQCSP